MAEQTTVNALNEFGWFDLSVGDPERARNFYSELLGWTAEVVPDPQAGGYGFFRYEGKEVGGVGPKQDPNQPSAWTAYVLVGDANATAAAAKENGGTLYVEPFDVMGQGVMAVIGDPAGAVFGIWQPGQRRGVELKNAQGGVCWVDSMSRDPEASKRFYEAVFGWEAPRFGDASGGDYWAFERDGTGIAGLFPPMPGIPEGVPSYWQIHFAVSDADTVARRASELGGGVNFGPQDLPGVGRSAILRDPEGVTFGILQPLPRQEG